MGLLENAQGWTRDHWEEDESFKKAWGAAELEIETAAKKGRHSTQLLYGEKERAQAIAAKMRHEGFEVSLDPGKKTGSQFSNFYVTVSWAPR